MKREIIIEVERVRVIYNRKNKGLKWCAFCQSAVEILTLEEALEIAGIDLEAVCDLLEQGEIHLYQTAGEDKPQVCLNSLLNAVGGEGGGGNHLF